MTTTELPSDRPAPTRWDWRVHGSCRDIDLDMFFAPDDRERRTVRTRRERHAKQICRHCPVLVECRTHAITAAERYGIWGGMSETERARLARQRPPTHRP
jgi:WhiB family redox-sensing transcriptional regulator